MGDAQGGSSSSPLPPLCPAGHWSPLPESDPTAVVSPGQQALLGCRAAIWKINRKDDSEKEEGEKSPS